MRVLLTNNTLGERAGTELYLYDVALELLRRGHHPVAFSTVHGEVAGLLRAATVPVIDNLDQLGQPPDIIHGQHHYETLTASLYYPDVPVVNFCHGWVPTQEEPFLSSQVVRYVAVDDTCRDRLVDTFGIDPGRVEVLLNFVDTTRFRPRTPLPAKPVRALAFGNYFTETTQLAAIQDACHEAGIHLDVIGSGSGHAIANPEDVLPLYDLVFARAKAALEAIAVGTAVILAGPRGFGPMVNTQNWPELRRINFGVRALDLPVCMKSVADQIARYDSADALELSGLAQHEVGLVEVCDRLLELYEQVILEWRSIRPGLEGQRAAARHLNRYSAAFKKNNVSIPNERLQTLDVFDKLLRGKQFAAAEKDGVLQGYVETAVRFYGVMKVTGWAAPRDANWSCIAVFVIQDGRCAAVAYMEIPRPDVAKYLGNRKTAFGFEVQFPAEQQPVKVLALVDSGELFDISGLSSSFTQRVLNGTKP